MSVNRQCKRHAVYVIWCVAYSLIAHCKINLFRYGILYADVDITPEESFNDEIDAHNGKSTMFLSPSVYVERERESKLLRTMSGGRAAATLSNDDDLPYAKPAACPVPTLLSRSFPLLSRSHPFYVTRAVAYRRATILRHWTSPESRSHFKSSENCRWYAERTPRLLPRRPLVGSLRGK